MMPYLLNSWMAKKYDWNMIQDAYDSGKSLRALEREFGMSSRSLKLAVDRGDLVTRSRSDALKTHYAESPKGPMANEQKQKLSEAMKLRHAEGRAWNIGQSRWNNQPSYPEQWFMTVMENEGFGDGYIRELPFGRFSLDFAWPGKKLCIEIDGEQHDRCEKQKSRDIAKDQLLAEHGWQVLRLKWKEVYHNPKHWIAVAKEFYSCGNLQ